jgi:flagellin-like protein
MKGISAIIAVILILMITVALAAMAYVWFTDVFKTVTEGAGKAATGASETIATSFSIASAAMNQTGTINNDNALDVYVTNTGSTDITTDNFNVFVEGTKGIARIDQTEIGPGKTATLTVDNTTTIDEKMTCDASVKVTYGSLEQFTSIVC